MEYLLIEDEVHYQRFVDENQDINWIGLDTEFIGERRFFTSLCLIQVGTANGNYIFDPLKFKETPYLEELIQNENVVVITHAGSNDFKLLYQEYGIKPTNSFDLQIAAAFLGYNYPVSFKFIMETFMDIHLPKSHTVTNWEKRPLTNGMLKYAVQDVEFLGELYVKFKTELEAIDRLSWCLDECAKATKDEFFVKQPYPELRNNNFFTKLKTRERIVYLKMLDWRLAQAIKSNKPKEAIIPVKTINVLARMHHLKLEHLRDDRRINPRVFDLYRNKILYFIEQSNGAYEEKLAALNISKHRADSPQEYNIDLMFELIKLRAKNMNVAPELVLTKKKVRQILEGKLQPPYEHESGWRSEMLGPKLIEWIKNPNIIQVDFEEEGQRFIIH